MTALPPLDPDPLVVDDDDGPYWRGFYRGTMSQPVWSRIIVLFAIAILVAFVIGLAAGQASAAPRSAATAIPAAELVLTGTSSSGNPSLPSGAPLPASILETQDPGELTSSIVGGKATWYCGGGSPCTAGYGPTDLVAAIDPGLGIRKGSWLVVHHEGRSVRVQVVDVCACGGTRIVDLSRLAFAALSPDQSDEGRAAFVGRGVIDVAIEEVGAEVTVPPTEVEP